MEMTFTTEQAEEWFLDWLDGHPVPLRLAGFQTVFENSDTPLPAEAAEMLGLPPGSTFGHAARSSISVTLSDGVEHRVATTIRFGSEEDSLRWWRNNRHNPGRGVELGDNNDGTYSLRIAPIDGANADWPSAGF